MGRRESYCGNDLLEELVNAEVDRRLAEKRRAYELHHALDVQNRVIVGARLPREFAAKVKHCAHVRHMSTYRYIRTIMEEAVAKDYH